MRVGEDHQVELSKERALDALLYAAIKDKYHPVRDYLNGLSSKCSPLDDDDWQLIAHTIFGSNDVNANLFLQRQLIGLVARVMDPGCKFDTALEIHSREQGLKKSEFWSVLGGERFSDSLGSLKQVKEDQMILHRAWIHEWSEIDHVFGRTAAEELKSFLSRKEDHFRPPTAESQIHSLVSAALLEPPTGGTSSKTPPAIDDSLASLRPKSLILTGSKPTVTQSGFVRSTSSKTAPAIGMNTPS